VSSYSFDSFKENLWLLSHYVWIYASSIQCSQVTCHVAQFSMEVSSSINLCSIIHFHTHVSMHTFSISSKTIILISFLLMMGIHHGLPSMSFFLSTSTHHPGVRLRNQLVPWSLHASMGEFRTFNSGFPSLTSDRKIRLSVRPKLIDSHSRECNGYLGIHCH
jgi:hypothetical protein